MSRKTIHTLVTGDSRNMSLIPDQSVHLIVTSPPCWQPEDCGDGNLAGFHGDYESYINSLNLVWKECFRVLHQGCRMCINIGDQFARSARYDRYKVIPIRTEIIRMCEALGMDYMGAFIWQKQAAVGTSAGAVAPGSFPYPRNGVMKIDYEFILIFKKQGSAPAASQEQKAMSAMTKEEWYTYFASHWNFAGAKQDGDIAVFPEELPRRLIKMFSFAGETVLDPFMGSGTTALAASNLQRDSIGYEINPDYKRRYVVKVASSLPFDDVEHRYLTDSSQFDLQEKIEALPYTFHAPREVRPKTGIKRPRSGSKTGKDNPKRKEYFSVKSILAPNLVQLDTGLIVRLIGIRPLDSTSEQAISFIEQKTKGRRVFMRYDSVKHDDSGHLLCYLYLESRTFINAHLLKRKLAAPETEKDYKFKSKFMSYCRPKPDVARNREVVEHIEAGTGPSKEARDGEG